MPHATLVHNGSGGSVVPRVDSTLGGLRTEAEGSGEGGDGGECPHGRRRGSLKERVIRVGQRRRPAAGPGPCQQPPTRVL
jgi:hypothetical protein